MSLTSNDLQAIQGIVQTTVQAIVDRAIEESDQRTAAAFAEVHEEMAVLDGKFTNKFDTLQQTVDRIEHVQRAEVERNDRQDKAIQRLREQLHIA